MAIHGGYGSQLLIDVPGLTIVARVSDLDFPEFEKILAPSTVHDSASGYAELIAPGKRKLNQISCTLNWDISEETHEAMVTAFDSDATVDMRVEEPEGDEGISFAAHILSVGRMSEQEEHYQAEILIQPSGSPTLYDIYYVDATNGSDSNGGNLSSDAWQTIAKVNGESFSPGDRILFKRGETWNERLHPIHSGVAGNLIYYGPYGSGAAPILDGDGAGIESWAGLLHIHGAYTIVDGFEIQDAPYLGVSIAGNYIMVSNLNVHDSQYNGISMESTALDCLIENCHVWNNVLTNEDFAMGESGWAAAVSDDGTPGYHTVRGNLIHDNWGEGIGMFATQHITIEDNVCYDNSSIEIYFEHTPYQLCQRNLAYKTGDGAATWRDPDGVPVIAFTDEVGEGEETLSDITFINNLVMGGGLAGCYFWLEQAGSGLKNVLIANNTFVNADNGALLKIAAGTHSGTRIENNIFLQEDAVTIADVPDDAGLSFSHNLWSKATDPDASSPDDVVGDPLLAKTGESGPGTLTSAWFKILVASPAIEEGKDITEVTEDYFSSSRSSPPDMGAHEYVA